MKNTLTILILTICFMLNSLVRASDVGPQIGQQAPPITLQKILQGPEITQVNWPALQGKVVVVEFWATWCAPCVGAIGHLNELAEKFKDKPVIFVAVTDEDETAVTPFLAKRPIHAWIGLNPDRAMFNAFHVDGIPETVLVDTKGIIDAITHPDQVGEAQINNLLAGRASGLKTATGDRINGGDIPNSPADEISPLYQVMIRASQSSQSSVVMRRFRATDAGIPLPGEMGGITLVRISIKGAIAWAFDVTTARVVVEAHLPSGMFDYVVKLPATKADRCWPLLQSAIEETFGLTLHRENRETEVYVLTSADAARAKRLATTQPDAMGFTAAAGKITCLNLPMPQFVKSLETSLSKPVIDQTGITGNIDSNLHWNADNGSESLLPAIQDQMGLKLTSAKRMLEMVVVTNAK